jgi:hypothetical protein
MKPSPGILLALALVLSTGDRAEAQVGSRGQQSTVRNGASTLSSIAVLPQSSRVGNHRGVTHYFTGFDGDHSLDAAIIAEQVFARYSLYTVRLQFASGAEESISVTAPPGGLQPEMRDMSGDSVPNDLVLTSKLLGSTLIVLLNDGHDHFTVVSAPGAFSPDEDRTSGTHQVHHTSALASHGFRSAGLMSGGGLLLLQSKENLIFPFVPRFNRHSSYSSISGRAPPLVTQIWRELS